MRHAPSLAAFVAVIVGSLGYASPAPAQAESEGMDYMRVLPEMFSYRRPPEPIFLPDGERFWFAAGPPDSTVIFLVDPARDRVEPLFDIARTRRALAPLGVPGLTETRGLPFDDFEWMDGGEARIRFFAGGEPFTLDVESYSAAPTDGAELRSSNREPRVLRPGLFLHGRPIFEVPSPDGEQLAFDREGDLWIRSAEASDSVRLTRDGAPDHGWEVEGARWSPGGGRIAALKMDRRNLPMIPLVRWTQPGTPVERHPYSRAGDSIARPELYLVDAHGGGTVRADLGVGGEPYVHAAAWHAAGRELYVLRMNRLMTHLALLGIDPASGSSREILSESSDTFLWGLPFLQGYGQALDDMHIFTPLADGARFLWRSERDGAGRVYLYGLNGELIRALTPDSLTVEAVEFVDEANGWAYFTASDPRAEFPYSLSLYRASLAVGPDGSAERLFELPELGSLDVTTSGDFLAVLRSGLDQPPTLELRRADGRLVRTLWTADTTLLADLGWTPPERFSAVAADGETALHGAIIKPTDFDPTGSYPIIERIYAGPQVIQTPRAMWYQSLWRNQWLAEQGFVVVVVDGRGTPGRGKAFQDVVHGRFGQFEIDDHAAAIREAAATRPYMDLSRVGIAGHSWGGHFTLRALLTRPDFYHVGVASAPAVDPVDFRVSLEPYMGCLPAECPDLYAAAAITSYAGELRGELLLVHGTRDDDVPFSETMRMADALIAAGKQFDLLVVPDADHVSFLGPYFQEVLRSYFVRQLEPR